MDITCCPSLDLIWCVIFSIIWAVDNEKQEMYKNKKFIWLYASFHSGLVRHVQIIGKKDYFQGIDSWKIYVLPHNLHTFLISIWLIGGRGALGH